MLIVGEDHHGAGTDGVDRLEDPLKPHHRISFTNLSTYLPTMSTSRFTCAPTPFPASVVFSIVCGISASANAAAATRLTVRLMPSTAIEPFSTTERRIARGARIDSSTPGPSGRRS